MFELCLIALDLFHKVFPQAVEKDLKTVFFEWSFLEKLGFFHSKVALSVENPVEIVDNSRR